MLGQADGVPVGITMVEELVGAGCCDTDIAAAVLVLVAGWFIIAVLVPPVAVEGLTAVDVVVGTGSVSDDDDAVDG